MKYLLLLLLLCNYSFLFSQLRNQESDNGYNIFYYSNKQISSEGNMINGEPDGIWKSYYVNGVIKSIGKRRNLQLDSVWVFYNELGAIKEKINYLDGKKNGYYYSFEYFKNKNDSLVGYLASQEMYLNNQKNGISEYFYSNGVIYLSVNYANGLKNGFAREYNQQGILTTIIDYRLGIEVDRELINQYRDSLKYGPWKEFYPNGKIKREENYQLGVLHGLVKTYDLSGELLTAYRFEGGILKDTSVIIESDIDIKEDFYDIKNEKGELIKKSSGGFADGIPIGVHRTYDSLGRVNSSRSYDREGNLIAEGIVNDEGDKLGEWKYYYPSLIIKSRGSYKNDRRIGEWKYYYENGNIEQEGLFRNGSPDGLWKWYFEGGKLKREEYYKLGVEEGESYEYDDEGILVANGSYIDGLKEGKWIFNYYFHTEEGNFKNGDKDGKWIYYYANKKVYFEGAFSQGNSIGKHLYYYPNGKLKEVQYYNFGIKEKNWEYYDYYGTLIKILTFEDDKLTKIDGISVETD